MISTHSLPCQMAAVVFTAPLASELRSVPLPRPGPGEVLVQTACCLICATDMEIYEGKLNIGYPLTPGHEWAGTVVAAGDNSGTPLLGQRIVAENKRGCGQCELCQRGFTNCCPNAVEVGFQLPGAYAEYVVARVSQTLVLPNTLSFTTAAFTEPVAVCLYHLRTLAMEPLSRVVIIGPGPIGLICTQLVSHMGAQEIIVTGTRRNRLALAQQYGATAIIDIRNEDPRRLVEHWPLGGADLVIETSGTVAGLNNAIELVRYGGKVGLLGAFGSNTVPFPGQLALDKNLTIQSTAASPGVWERALEAISSSIVQVDTLLTHTYTLSDHASAFATVRNRQNGLVKAAFIFN